MDSRSPTCCPSRPCSRSRADASQRHRARASPRPRAGPWRVPDGGRLPHAVIDDEGTTHLVYLKGEPVEGDLMYVTRGPGATTWSEPAQVNSEPGTVTGIGPIDGGHLAQGRDTCHMPGARDQKSWDAGLGGTKRDGCGTNPCGCCGSCVAPPRARPPPRRIARFRSLRHKLAAWLDGTPQTGASVTDGPRRGSPASPFPWSGCGPHRVGQSSCRVARMRPRVGIPLIPEDPGIKTSDRVHRGRVPALKGLPKGRQTRFSRGSKPVHPPSKIAEWGENANQKS